MRLIANITITTENNEKKNYIKPVIDEIIKNINGGGGGSGENTSGLWQAS